MLALRSFVYSSMVSSSCLIQSRVSQSQSQRSRSARLASRDCNSDLEISSLASSLALASLPPSR